MDLDLQSTIDVNLYGLGGSKPVIGQWARQPRPYELQIALQMSTLPHSQ